MPILDGVAKATDCSIEELLLVGTSGRSVDLREIMVELNLHEDLFGNTMNGSLLVQDTNNLINQLPIIGMEFLMITVSKPSSPWKIKKVFRVYKISDRQKDTTTERYILHFCSEEAIVSESVKISKSYKGQTISAMVRDICMTYLKINPKKLQSTDILDTQGTFDIVIPYWRPFYAINWLARMGKTAQAASASFVFFEDSQGYHFKPIETLTQQEPLQAINFMPVNFAGEKEEKSDTTIKHESAFEYEMHNSPDMLRGFGIGTYAGKLTMVDPFAQKITLSSTDSSTLFKQTKHLNNFPHLQLNEDRTNKSVTEHHESFFRVASNKLKPDTWLLQRNSYLAGLHGFQMKVALPGNIILRAGQVVQANFAVGGTPSRESKLIDELYSGNYLITAVRHKIQRTHYVCILEISKDSLTSSLPAESFGSPAMNAIRSR